MTQDMKKYLRLIVDRQLEPADIVELYDIAQAHAATELVVTYDQEGDQVTGAVTEYDSGDRWIYEILLEEHLQNHQGEAIVSELTRSFDWDFEFEITTE